MPRSRYALMFPTIICSLSSIVDGSRHSILSTRWMLSNGQNLAKPHAAPWLAEHATEWPWESVASHDLASMLSVVRDFAKPFGQPGGRPRVSAVLTTLSLHSLLLNWVWSLVTYGNSHAFVVVVADDDSLSHCRSLRLPCWDARPTLAGTVDLSSISGSYAYNYTAQGSGYNRLVHAKPAVVLELLKHGFDVHFSDVDVVFLRDVWASFDALLDLRNADVSFMREVWSAQGNDNRINSGHVMVRNNNRTRTFYEAYAGGHEQRPRYTGDQGWLNNGVGLKGTVYDVCDDADSCTAITGRGLAAVAPYSEQGGPWNPCVHQATGDLVPVCLPWQVAIHFICMVGRENKLATMRGLGLLLVEEDGSVFEGATALPCVGSVARLQDYNLDHQLDHPAHALL